MKMQIDQSRDHITACGIQNGTGDGSLSHFRDSEPSPVPILRFIKYLMDLSVQNLKFPITELKIPCKELSASDSHAALPVHL